MSGNKKKKEAIAFNDGWCFAIVNGRLAEIFFREKYGIYGHCYVKRKEYTKSEQKMIDADTPKYQFIYRKGYYINKSNGIKQKIPAPFEVFPKIKNI